MTRRANQAADPIERADLPALPADAAPDIEAPSSAGSERVVQRPDGYHWVAPDGRQEFGPFETREAAMADMLDAADEESPQPGETLQEAESEIGIADWIDPETGEPAEGLCPPHLEQE